jgi:hypothetical protein
MFNWAKQQMANVAGTAEPIHGPEAIQAVTKQAETVPYTELTKDDLKWKAMGTTCVETQTFYFTSDDGHIGFAQVIYSNVMYVASYTLSVNIHRPNRGPIIVNPQAYQKILGA